MTSKSQAEGSNELVGRAGRPRYWLECDHVLWLIFPDQVRSEEKQKGSSQVSLTMMTMASPGDLEWPEVNVTHAEAGAVKHQQIRVVPRSH
jgi:hypothetical protein